MFAGLRRSDFSVRSHRTISAIYSLFCLLQVLSLNPLVMLSSEWNSNSSFPHFMLVVLSIITLLRLNHFDEGSKKVSSVAYNLTLICIFTVTGFIIQELILLEISILPIILSVFFFSVQQSDDWISSISIIIAYISSCSLTTQNGRIWTTVAIIGTVVMTVYTIFIRSIIIAAYKTTNETFDCIAILRNKIKAEITLMDTIVGSSLPRNLCKYLARATDDEAKCLFFVDESEKKGACQAGADSAAKGGGADCTAAGHRGSVKGTIDVASSIFKNDEKTQTLIGIFLDEGLLLNPKESYVPIDRLARLNGMSRQFCVMLSFKISIEGNDEAFTNMDKAAHLHASLDILCAKYNIDKVHNFGGVWVGCMGFFDFFDAQSLPTRSSSVRHCLLCRDAILASIDIMATFDHYKWEVRCTIDCGYVMAGFLVPGEFNMLGQEVRFVMQNIDYVDVGSIIVTKTITDTLETSKSYKPNSIKFMKIALKANDFQRSENRAFIVVNLQDLVNSKEVDLVNVAMIKTFLESAVSPRFHREQQTVNTALSAHLAIESYTSKKNKACDDDIAWEKVVGIHVNETFSQYIRKNFIQIVRTVFSIPSVTKGVPASAGYESTRCESSHNDRSIEGVTGDDTTDSVELQSIVETIVNKYAFESPWFIAILVPKFKGGPASLKSAGGARIHHRKSGEPSFAWRVLQFTITTLRCGGPKVPSRETLYHEAGLWQDESCGDDQHSGGHENNVSSNNTFAESDADDGDSLNDHLSETDSTKCGPSLPTENNQPSQRVLTFSLNRFRFTRWDQFFLSKTQFDMSSNKIFLVTVSSICLGFLGLYYFEVSGLFSANENGVSINVTFFRDFFCICLFGQLILPYFIGKEYARYASILVFIMRYNVAYYIGYSLKNDLNSKKTDYNLNRFYSDETIAERGNNYPISCIELVLVIFNFNSMVLRIDNTFVWSLFAEVFCTLAILCSSLFYGDNNYITNFRSLSTISVRIFFLLNIAVIVPLWSIGYSRYINFIQQTYLLPHLKESLKIQRIRTREVVQLLARNSHFLQTNRLGRDKVEVGVCTVYVRAADMLSGLIADKEFFVLIRDITGIIDTCLKETGMIKLDHFSGIVVTLAPRYTDLQSDLHSVVTYRARLVLFVRMLLRRIDDFNNLNNINVSIGIGANLGDVAFDLWWGGSLRFRAFGSCLDESTKMALYQEDSVYACCDLLKEVNEGKHNETLGRNFKVVEERNWIKLEKYFNGMRIQDFAYVCMLGRGGYGSVHLCSEVVTGNSYAIKVVPRSRKSSASKLLQREISILQRMFHPNIVQFKYCIISTSKIYLVLGYCSGGTLSEVIDKDSNINLPRLCFWYAELVLALEYVHMMGIIHRDVKPANCLIDIDGHLKLADFGLSKTYVADEWETETSRDKGNNDVLQRLLPAKINIAYDDAFNHDNPYRILLVEVSYFSLTKVALENMLFIVHLVRSTAEAIGYLDSYNNIDMILVSLGSEDVPSHDSILLLNKLSTAPKFRDIPLIALWTADDVRVSQLCQEAGARALMPLPMHFNYRDVVIDHCRTYRVNRDSNLAKLSPDVPYGDNRKSVSIVESRPSWSVGNVAISAEDYRNKLSLVKHSSVLDGDQKNHSGVGTLNFMAPEVIRSKQYGRAVDWWACGVSFYECATRCKLFQGVDKDHTMKQITTGPIDLSFLHNMSPELEDLVGGLLVREPTERMGCSGALPIMQHPFFSGVAWDSISYSDTQYKPAQKINKDWKNGRDLFYGNEVDVPHTAANQSEEHASGSISGPISSPWSTNIDSSSSINRFIKLRMLYKKKRGKSHTNFEHIRSLRRLWVSGDLSKVGKQPSANSRSGMLHKSMDSLSIQEEISGSKSKESQSKSKSKSESIAIVDLPIL